jgi:hypothetical protein
MKKSGIFGLIFTLFFLAGNVYGQTVMLRPNSSIGYFSAGDAKGLSYTYGAKILLTANEFQRYGIKADHLNVLTDNRKSYICTGLFVEQVLFKHFNTGIGTVGYINTIEPGENPFGIYTHLGFEYCFNKNTGIVASCQSDFIFRKSFAMNNAFLLEIGLKF